MKYIFFTFLFGGLMTASALASDVTVAFSGNKNYQVLIDGRTINSNGYYGNLIRMDDLRPGRHSIQIFQGNGKRNKNQLVYSSNFILQPQYDLFITVDNRGRVQMAERRANDYGRKDNRDNDRYRKNDRNEHYGKQKEGYGNTGGWNNKDSRAMSDADFNQLEKKIRGQWFGKLNKAKEGLRNNYFTTSQVRQILQIFSSENDRLELAKLAYGNTVDPNNFRQLYELFSYPKQVELDRYIKSYRY